MRVLRLVAVNESGTHLLLRAEVDGTEFVLPLDSRIRAAVNGDKERLGQLEVPVDNQIRPRDIQARIRAGESVESVAHSANVSVERVMRYAGPVLAERSHIADLARRSSVRRPGASGPAPLLDDAVTAELGKLHISEHEILWDALRRDDGRWIVRAGWHHDGEDHTAEWTFDPAGRSVSPANEEGRWLGGERRPPAEPPPGPARLTVVTREGEHHRDNVRALKPTHSEDPDEFDPAGDFAEDFPEEFADDPADAPTADLPLVEDPDEADESRLRLSDIASRVEIEDQADSDLAGHPAPRTRAAAATGSTRNRRPSVPSWDEIMFGSRRSDD